MDSVNCVQDALITGLPSEAELHFAQAGNHNAVSAGVCVCVCLCASAGEEDITSNPSVCSWHSVCLHVCLVLAEGGMWVCDLWQRQDTISHFGELFIIICSVTLVECIHLVAFTPAHC